MRTILIVLPSYAIGGTTLSLYALLSKIDPSILKVDVLAKPEGYYNGRMPNCKELGENFWLSYPLVKGSAFKKTLQKLIYGTRYVLSKMHINLFPLIYWLGGIAIKSKQYDAVVSYSEGMAYLNSFIPAKKRITWIHCDYRRHLSMNKYEKEIYAYSKYDVVVAVSQFAKKSFVEVFPQYAEKVHVIYNGIDVLGIINKSKQISGMDSRFVVDDSFVLVSIGRLDPVKQFDLIPDIASHIKQLTNRPFRWYIIGGGSTSWINTIKQEISKCHVDDNVILLGEQANVYPYLSKANMLVHTSKSESFSLVVKEAKALNIPSMINNYECATEFVEDGINGMIVPVNEMADRISQIIENPFILTPIIDKLKNWSEINNSEVEHFLGLV